MDREALEARAKELGVTFPANIGDEKLAARVEEAEAALANGGATDDKPKKKKPKDKATGETVTVVCAVADGRRRAGRRWAGGENHVPVDEFTEEMEASLAKDPMFQVFEA